MTGGYRHDWRNRKDRSFSGRQQSGGDRTNAFNPGTHILELSRRGPKTTDRAVGAMFDNARTMEKGPVGDPMQGFATPVTRRATRQGIAFTPYVVGMGQRSYGEIVSLDPE